MSSRRELNIEATRAALLTEARAQFAALGFSKAELGQIAAGAGLTTGAIYHHFGSKTGLFRAVAEQLETDILAAAATAGDPDPLVGLREGFENLIDLCARADVQRIIFIEAPQVLGPETWREIELRYALGAVREVLAGLTAQGVIRPYPTDLLARVLLALLREASAELARAGDDPEIRAQISALTSSVFDGLFARG
jgi:AcrR family transcriptional regulator